MGTCETPNRSRFAFSRSGRELWLVRGRNCGRQHENLQIFYCVAFLARVGARENADCEIDTHQINHAGWRPPPLSLPGNESRAILRGLVVRIRPHRLVDALKVAAPSWHPLIMVQFASRHSPRIGRSAGFAVLTTRLCQIIRLCLFQPIKSVGRFFEENRVDKKGVGPHR